MKQSLALFFCTFLVGCMEMDTFYISIDGDVPAADAGTDEDAGCFPPNPKAMPILCVTDHDCGARGACFAPSCISGRCEATYRHNGWTCMECGGSGTCYEGECL